MSPDLISFIIPAHNEADYIRPTIEALHRAGRASSRPYEIIVAADACTDDTVAIAREAGAHLVIEIDKRQIAAVRNAGAAAANGDLFIFVDADTVAPPATVLATLQAVARGAIGGGAYVEFDHFPSRWEACMAWAFTRLYRCTRFAAGCYVYTTREAFHAVGGFDELYFASEEVGISMALRKYGRFRLITAPVITSARKLHMHTTLGIFGQLIWLALQGPAAVQKREGLDLWYGPHRGPGSNAESQESAPQT